MHISFAHQIPRLYTMKSDPPSWYRSKSDKSSGVARAFPGGRLAHPEGQNEEENK